MPKKYKNIIIPIEQEILEKILRDDNEYVLKERINDETYFRLPEITLDSARVSEKKIVYTTNPYVALSNEGDFLNTQYRYESAGISFSFKERIAYLNDVDLKLDKNKMILLRIFLENSKIVLTKERLITSLEAHTRKKVSYNTLIQEIKRLRHALGDEKGTIFIETRWGLGYKWIPPVKKYEI